MEENDEAFTTDQSNAYGGEQHPYRLSIQTNHTAADGVGFGSVRSKGITDRCRRWCNVDEWGKMMDEAMPLPSEQHDRKWNEGEWSRLKQDGFRQPSHDSSMHASNHSNCSARLRIHSVSAIMTSIRTFRSTFAASMLGTIPPISKVKRSSSLHANASMTSG